MRRTPNKLIDGYRETHPTLGDSERGQNYGYFRVRLPNMGLLDVIASDGLSGEGWEHVSVSTPKRCPTWQEMCAIKELFWDDSETVVQFHPAKSEYVNYHPFCLHLWRKLGSTIQLPPALLIGPRRET